MFRMRAILAITLSLWASVICASEQDNAHLHSPWQAQLERYVSYTADNGKSSEVNYSGWQRDSHQLRQYADSLAEVTRDEYETWDESRQLAFLINAYNAHTVLLILQHYPDLSSIRDIGGWFSSPWSEKVANLLGEQRTLDEIEHGMIRGQDNALREDGFDGFSEPRIHFAVNCASRGCPPLRNEAYTADKLDAQLEHQTRQFLSNRNQNYFRGRTLYLSSIFKWYEEDFTRGWNNWGSLEAFLLHYADALNLDAAEQQTLQEGKVSIKYNDYNWALNDIAD
ncbi:DUF547 domain-containing protein [Salinimonas iocasae]|uniref:DUF547 domain-containing protein n=1 Tax=Salinimonas iocasae TaxID=2572577 RepID=A0A5B7YDK0_9ALTE|nr:DUF547 domain-containing protein [Salinimonas iocasae]QCZ93797.1 DUF547 domain-containing protein [Salinimonas iocasae]